MSGLAGAVHTAARSQARKARNVVRAEVVGVSPLRVMPMQSSDVLDDDDFDLTKWMEFYDGEFGIEVGDTVLLMREGGEWSMFDIQTDNELDFSKAKSIDLDAVNDRIAALEARVEELENV